MPKKKTPNTPNATKSNVFNNAYSHCNVDTRTDPVSCSADFPVAKADLDQAPKGVDQIVWAQAEATGGCRNKVQAVAQKVSPCECKYDPDNKMMHCHCYDPDSLNPPRPHRPDI